jgi:hypothetical protein
VDPFRVFAMCSRVTTYTGRFVRNAVCASMFEGTGIQFGCVCAMAITFGGNAPIHRPMLASPGSGHGTLVIAPFASRTMNALCSMWLNPQRACSSRPQKILSAAGCAARSGHASHAVASIAIALPITTATAVAHRIVILRTTPVDTENRVARYRTTAFVSEQLFKAFCASA